MVIVLVMGLQNLTLESLGNERERKRDKTNSEYRLKSADEVIVTKVKEV